MSKILDLLMWRTQLSTAEAYVSLMEAEVDAALNSSQRWSEVKAVVAALRTKPTLTSREVRNAIDSVSRSPRYLKSLAGDDPIRIGA